MVVPLSNLSHNKFMNFIYVGLGGFLGAVSRYSVGLLLPSTGFPWATLFVNALGCLAISIFASRTLPTHVSLFLIPGFLGAFTTFSAFGLETIRLMQNNQPWLAAANVAANLLIGLGAVYIYNL
jgi:fluoride exporter